MPIVCNHAKWGCQCVVRTTNDRKPQSCNIQVQKSVISDKCNLEGIQYPRLETKIVVFIIEFFSILYIGVVVPILPVGLNCRFQNYYVSLHQYSQNSQLNNSQQNVQLCVGYVGNRKLVLIHLIHSRWCQLQKQLIYKTTFSDDQFYIDLNIALSLFQVSWFSDFYQVILQFLLI
ncbi:Hypothetical_protein [Hexamita inflata]|uniref:Hypothetical_protein n=1 Tax=Hexamita inflata TaxID=28002 RepID=A0ABP1H508_9EUKA